MSESPIDQASRKRPKAPPWQPFYFAVMLLLGVFIGTQSSDWNGNGLAHSGERGRLVHILDRIEQTYVDPIVRDELENIAVEAILEKLDPHSLYFSASELAAMAEPMEGNFEGIGVEFIIQDDTLMVVAAIQGGPAERAGVRAGDRILLVDSLDISGPQLTNKRVMELLKGPRNTEVRVGLERLRGTQEVLLVRDRIPIHSVVATLPLDSDMGYVKVIRFAQNTADEFETAMETLAAAGLHQVVIDLRGNGGGYLNAVVPMVESFLMDDQVIVFTEGAHSPRRTYRAQGNGSWRDWDIVVLVNETSASASEIFAGAIQDNDRGAIVGRRSFGKGLVQEEFDLSGSGALRLTVARFHTPTGRAIQKPYGATIEYEADYFDRYDGGELFHADSISVVDSLQYQTPGGRIVYGGGGIAPDFFVALDTAQWSGYLADLSWSGVLRDAAFGFVDAHRLQLSELDLTGEWPEELQSEAMTYLHQEAALSGYESPVLLPQEAHALSHRFMAQIVRNAKGEAEYYGFLLEEDLDFHRAAEVLSGASVLQVIDGRLTLATQSSNQSQKF